jgi:hypothetical protein
MNYAEPIPKPDRSSINTHCTGAKVDTMRANIGSPREPLTAECQQDKASDKVKALLETRNVGPFRVTGIKPFLDLLTAVFARVKTDDPALYAALGTAGVLCVRLIRGSTSTPSNHCWGTAIDMKMRSSETGRMRLDPRGDNKVQIGCMELYKYFKKHGEETGEWCFWGAGFSTEDGMHFEASDELIRRWAAEGKL